MPQVTFYLLTSGNLTAGQFACRLTDKAWRNNHTIHIHTDDEAAGQQLDKLLWEWREDSFIPHQILTADSHHTPPVTIGFGSHHNIQSELLINLSPSVPSFYPTYKRVCEIVANTDDSISASREKFREYKKAGIAPETHKIGSAG